MRYGGEPTSSQDTKAVLTLGYVSSSFIENSAYFSGSQSSSLDTAKTPDAQNYTVSIPSGHKMRNGSLILSVNGLALSSNTNQTTSGSGTDFYISSSTDGVFSVQKQHISSGVVQGINLDENDNMTVNYSTIIT